MKRQKHFTMRIIIILGLALIFSLQLKAKEISEAKALDIANSFFQKNETRAIDNSLRLLKIADSNTLLKGEISTLSSTLSPTFYIFAPENNKGFVIVSGDDSTRPILGYSFDNEVSTLENLPCNFKYWLKAMDSQVTYYREMGDELQDNSEEEDLNVGNIVTKYETALWDQLEPYLLQCPIDEDEEDYSLTGCGATALCIAMKYFSHPQRGQGSTPAYYTLSKNIFVDSRNLEHEYLWDDMLMEYNEGEYTQENADAIATLMADVGAVCYSDYTYWGTEVDETWIIEKDFASHFFYSPNMYLEYSYSYSEDEWVSFLIEEIERNNAPIPFFGYMPEDGHMFIIDGYTDNNYFSLNWGWSGTFNGYFLLPNIAYNQYQGAFLNFIPDDGSIPNATLGLYNQGIYSDTEVYANSVPFNVNVEYIINMSSTPFIGKFRLGLVNSEGEFKQWISEEIIQDEEIAPIADEITLYNVECIIQEDIAKGDRIRLYYMNNTQDEWKVMNSAGEQSIWEIVLNEDNTSKINTTNQDLQSASLDENIYDLSGRKVISQKHSGVYINKGKKIIRK